MRSAAGRPNAFLMAVAIGHQNNTLILGQGSSTSVTSGAWAWRWS